MTRPQRMRRLIQQINALETKQSPAGYGTERDLLPELCRLCGVELLDFDGFKAEADATGCSLLDHAAGLVGLPSGAVLLEELADPGFPAGLRPFELPVSDAYKLCTIET